MTDPRPGRARSVALALGVVFVWSTSWVLIKFGLEGIPPITFAGLRYSLAAAILGALFLGRGGARRLAATPRADVIRLAALGVLLYSLTQGAVFVALAWLPAITVNLLWSFSTLLVALIGIVSLGERPARLQWLGVGLAAAGALVYFGPKGWPAGASPGLIAAAVGVVANASASVLGRRVNRAGTQPPLDVTTVSMVAGAVPLLLAGLALEPAPQLDARSWLIIAWLAVVNTALAFTVWNLTLKTLHAVESSVLNGTMMIWIPLLAVGFLGERLSLIQGAGLLLAGVGTTLVQAAPARDAVTG